MAEAPAPTETQSPEPVPVAEAAAAAETLPSDAEWSDVAAAAQQGPDTRSLLQRALDDLVALKDELLRLTGSLSQEHQVALDTAVQNVVDAAAHPAIVKAADKASQ